MVIRDVLALVAFDMECKTNVIKAPLPLFRDGTLLLEKCKLFLKLVRRKQWCKQDMEVETFYNPKIRYNLH